MAARTETARVAGDERRQMLVRAAQELLADRGFEGLRVREVAERVGINNATLHYYFSTKQALVRGVVDDIVGRLERLPAGGGQLPPEQALRAHFDHVLGQMRDAPEGLVVLHELFARARRDAEVRATLADTDASWRAWLVPVLQAGVASGVFRADLDAGAAAGVITGFFKSLLLQLHLTPGELAACADQLERWITADGDTP
jgi:AcrR family transcriptional regulator